HDRPAQAERDQVAALRERHPDHAPVAAAVLDRLLPDRDALHRLRHRARVLLPARRGAAPERHGRRRRAPPLHRGPGRRVRVHLAAGGPRMALIPPPGAPPERAPRTDPNIDSDLRDVEVQQLEKGVLTTTLDKAIAWARSSSIWPATFGL